VISLFINLMSRRVGIAYKSAKAVLSDTWLKSTRTPNRFISLTSSFPRCLFLSIGHRQAVTYERPFHLGSGSSKIPPESANTLLQP
jgi:hypothetical protein